MELPILTDILAYFPIAKLVFLSPINLESWLGCYIYSIHGDYKPTNITRGVPNFPEMGVPLNHPF